MNVYKLSPDELKSFSDDATRGALRQRLAKEYPNGVHIEDADGNLMDTLGEVTPTWVDGSPELAVVLSDDEVEERRAKAELLKLEADHLEFDVRPLVMTKLRDEAKAEVFDRMREKTNQILLLESQLKRANGMLALGPVSAREELAALKQSLFDTQDRLTTALNELSVEADKTLELSKQLSETHEALESSKLEVASLQRQITEANESAEAAAFDKDTSTNDNSGAA